MNNIRIIQKKDSERVKKLNSIARAMAATMEIFIESKLLEEKMAEILKGDTDFATSMVVAFVQGVKESLGLLKENEAKVN